jgi:hypothetical protein
LSGQDFSQQESSQQSVIVPDAELLFTGDFHRAGPDLVITGHDGRHHLIPGYFSSEHPPALVAPNGATLSADTVTLLAGSPTPGEYAQAAPTPPPDAIGKVEKVVGDATVIRNGVSVVLHVGDAVYKSDIVQTGTGSSVGISFPDGTALNLVANTRMALNEYSYDPNSTSNAALMTLVEGTFAFVAGKVAHTGDMKIATPVATMGIRGTTGIVEQDAATVTANVAQQTYGFLLSYDYGTNTAGQYDLSYTDPNGVVHLVDPAADDVAIRVRAADPGAAISDTQSRSAKQQQQRQLDAAAAAAAHLESAAKRFQHRACRRKRAHCSCRRRRQGRQQRQ